MTNEKGERKDQGFLNHFLFLFLNGNHAHHRLPVLLLLRVDDPAFPRRHDVSRLDLEPPTIASELIGLSEPPFATRPPHEQVSVVIICVVWPIVDRVRLWHEEAQLVCVQAVRDTVAIRVHTLYNLT